VAIAGPRGGARLARFRLRCGAGLAESPARASVSYAAGVRPLAAFCIVLSCVALGGPSARAQSVVDLPSVDPAGFVGFTSTRTPGPFRLSASVVTDYAARPLRNVDGTQQDLDHRLSLGARARLGLGGRGALQLAVPAVALARGDVGEPGMADGALGVQVRVYGAPADARGEIEEGGAVSLDASTSLPWGQPRTLSADAKPRLRVGATADMRAFGVVAGLRAGYERRLSPPRVPVGRDRLSLQLGGQLPVAFFGRLAPGQVTEHLVFELGVASDAKHLLARDATAVEGSAMLRFGLANWGLSLGGSVGLLRDADTPAGRVFLAVYVSPRQRDSDADGIDDGEDACPDLAEDLDGLDDADGCPEGDSDGDGILDEDDRCPQTPADYDLDGDEDGCNDGA